MILGAILAVLAHPLFAAVASAFGSVLVDFVRSWLDAQAVQAHAAGRAEAVAEATTVLFTIEREMGAVALPEDVDVLERLQAGTA